VATASPASTRYLTTLAAAWHDHLAPRASDAPTVVSLFAGGGGSTLGHRMAGFQERLAVEWDACAVATLARNFPDTTISAGDIAALSVDEALALAGVRPGELDLLDGSPPCQGFSTAGKRRLDDPRNDLFREYARLLAGLQPRAFVLENVPGLVRGKMRLVFADCLRALAGCGYRVAARVLNAAYFGVPQARHRLIVIGIRDDLGITPSHPPAQIWPLPLRVALEAAVLLRTEGQDAGGNGYEAEDWLVPPLDDAYGQLWSRVRRGGTAADVLGKGFSNCVKPRLDRPCPTLPKTQGGHGFATIVHPLEPRALSVAEAALASSFPPGFRFVGSYQERWARIGNGVPPLLMRAIATHLRITVLDRSTADRGERVA
jgi:DNA (cytosine-5)-methyltransferase 1